ncbi:MAG: restriction endonuclease subunit S [Campylobacterales bacterium]|nr:restriction endonuclease subunit S [Campylobacterales bacterium]
MENLYDLPNGWVWKTLDECTELITKGTTPTTNGYKFLDKGINFLKIENIVNGEINLSTIEMFISEEAHQSQKRSQLEENDVLFSIAGTIGDTAIVKKEHLPMNTNQAIALIRPKKILNSSFLRYSLLSIVSENTKDKQRGGAIKNISLGDIKELMYPLPPLPEQKRIVAKLDLLFAKIDKSIALHQKNIDEANAFIRSVLNEVFGEMEEKYEKSKLDDLTSLITKGTTPTTNGFKFQNSGINFLKIENIVNGEIDLSTIEMFISEEAHQSQKRSQLEINDVLFSIAGTIGDTAIVKQEHLPMNTNQAIALIRPIEKLNSEFLRRVLSSSISNKTTNKQRGGAIKNVSLGDIKELELPLPPLPIQQKVVNYLDSVSQKMEKVKTIQKEKMANLKALKASILDKAFRGEL